MATTFLQQAQELIDELPYAETLTDVTGNAEEIQRPIDLLARADYQIQNLYLDWKFLWTQHAGTTTVAGDYDIAAPSDLGDYDRDSFCLDRGTANFKQLEWLSYRNWRDTYDVGVRDNAVPDYFTINPDKVIILEPPPIAGKVLTYDYWVAPTRMSAKTDQSAIPERYRRVAIARAKIWWGAQEEAPEIQADAQQEYAAILAQLKAAELPGQERQSRAESETFVQVPEW